MTHPPIPLVEQIAAVERAHEKRQDKADRHCLSRNRTLQAREQAEADRLAAALATLRGLLLIEETR